MWLQVAKRCRLLKQGISVFSASWWSRVALTVSVGHRESYTLLTDIKSETINGYNFHTPVSKYTGTFAQA